MHPAPTPPFRSPLSRELPAGLAVANLVMAVLCLLSSFQDRLVLAGFFAVVGIGMAVATAVAFRTKTALPPGAGTS